MSQRQPSMASQGQSSGHGATPTNSRTGKPPKDLIAERKARDQHLRSTTAELSTELRNEADGRKAAQAREEADKRRGLTHSRQVKHAEQRKQMQSVLEEIEAETQKNRELRLAHASEVKRHQLMQEDLVQRIRERQEKARLIRAKLELQGLRVQSLLAEHSHGADVAAAEEKREHESRVRARAVERLLQQRAATAMAMSSVANELEGVEERPQSTQLAVLNAPPSREDRNDDGQLILYQRGGAPALPSVGNDYRRPGTQAARRRLPSGARPLYHSHQQRSSRGGSPAVGPGPNSNSSAEIGDPTEESLNLPSVLHPSHSEGRPSTMQGRGGAGGGRSPVSRGKPKRIPLAARPVGVPPLPRITPEEEDPRRNSPSRYGSRGGAATTSPSRGGARPPTRALTAIEQATKKAESEMIRRVVLLAKKQTERHQQGPGAKKAPNLVAINVVGGVASPPESEGAQAANYLMSSRFKSALVGATQKAREWIQTFGGGLERLSPDMSPNRSAARNRAERARARGGESDENLGERSALDDPDLELRPLSERAATRAGRGEPGHQHSLPDPGYAEDDEFASPGRRHYDDGVDPNDPQFRDLAPSSSSSSVSSEDDGVEEDNEESEPTPTQPGVSAQEAPPQLEWNEADANDNAAAPTEQTPANESEPAPQPEADIQPTEEVASDSKVAEEKEVEGGERGADQTHASAEEQSATDAAVTDFVGQLLLGQVLAAVSEQQASEPQPQERADAAPVENEQQSDAKPEPSSEQPNEEERPETAVAAEDPTSPPQGEPDQVTESAEAPAEAASPVTAAEDSPDVPSENANVENEGQAPAAEEVVEPTSEIPPAEVSEPVAAASEEVAAAESAPPPQEQVVAAPEVPVDPFAVYLKPKASTLVMVIRLQRHWRSFGRFVLMLKKKLDRPPIAIRPNQQHVAVVVVDHEKFPLQRQEPHHLPAEVVEQEVQPAEAKPSDVNAATEERGEEKPADVHTAEQTPQTPSPESDDVEPTQVNATASPDTVENSPTSTPSVPQEDCSQALGLLSKLLQVQRQAKARLEAGPIVVPSTSVLSKLLQVQSEKEWILLQHQFTQSNAFSQSSILSGSASPAKVAGGTGQQSPTSPTLLGKSVEPTMALSTSAGGVAGADLLSSFNYRMVSSSFEWKKTLVAHRKSVTRKSVPRGSDAGLPPALPSAVDGQAPTIQVIPTPHPAAGQESDRDHLGTASSSLNRSAGAGRLSVSVAEVGSPVSERSLLMHRNRRRQSWSQPQEAQQIPPQQQAQSTEAMSGEDENAISTLLQDDNVFSVFPRHIGHRDRMPARVLMLIIRLQRYWRRIGHYRARHRRGEFVRFQLHTGATQTAVADEPKAALQEPVQPSSAPEQADEEHYDEEDYADDEPQPETAAPEANASSPANQARKEEEEDYGNDEYAEDIDEAEEEIVEVRPPAAGKSSRPRAPGARGSPSRPGTGDVDEDEDVDEGEVYSEDGEQQTVDDSRQSTAAGRPGQARGQGRRGESRSRSRKHTEEEAEEDYKDDEEYDDDDGAVDAEEEDFPAPPAGAQRDPDLEASDDDYSDDDQADEAVEDSEGESKRPSKKDSDGDDVAPARGSGSKPGTAKVASQSKKRSSDVDDEEEAEDLDDYSDDNNEAEEEVAPKKGQKNAPKASAKKGGRAVESDHDDEEAVDDYEDDTVE